MNEIELKKLWDKLQGKINVGDFERFKSLMSDVESRKRFYDKFYNKLKNIRFDLKSYDEYERRLSSGNNRGGGGNTGGSGSVSQGWLSDPTGNQTWEYQVRVCKWVARKKGQTTEYVISDNPKYKSSVDILNNTYPNLIKDCNKSSTQQTPTQPDNQNVVTGGVQQPNQPGSTTSTGSQPVPSPTQGLGVPNVSELGLDEIDKLVNPVKTESQLNNTQVLVDGSLEGVPRTQQESIEVNTDVLKEEFYSTLKKLS